jgi:hypothetical protein
MAADWWADPKFWRQLRATRLPPNGIIAGIVFNHSSWSWVIWLANGSDPTIPLSGWKSCRKADDVYAKYKQVFGENGLLDFLSWVAGTLKDGPPLGYVKPGPWNEEEVVEIRQIVNGVIYEKSGLPPVEQLVADALALPLEQQSVLRREFQELQDGLLKPYK